VERMAARPGMRSGSLVSSFSARQVSHPQVDEQREQDRLDEARRGGERERVEPVELGNGRALGCRAGSDGDDRGDDEDGEGEVLDAEQHVLQLLADLGAAVADPRHDRDECDTRERHDERVLGEIGVHQQPEVFSADLGQVGEHHHAGDRDTPAAHPADPRPERLGRPGEGRAAVGHGPVELAVGERDEEHRDEGEDERDRCLRADREHHEPERRGERVDRRGGREPDDRRPHEAESAGREPLAGRCRGGVLVRHRRLPSGGIESLQPECQP